MAELTITESALARLAEKIRSMSSSGPENACYRFNINKEGGLELAIDVPTADDKSFKYEDLAVLVISDALVERYAGRTLDVNAAGDFVLT